MSLLVDMRVDIILEEVEQEYTIPSHLEKYIRQGITRALRKIDLQNDMLSDTKQEQREAI